MILLLTLFSCWEILLSVCWDRKQSTYVTWLWVSGAHFPFVSLPRCQVPVPEWQPDDELQVLFHVISFTNRIHKPSFPIEILTSFLCQYETWLACVGLICIIDRPWHQTCIRLQHLDPSRYPYRYNYKPGIAFSL